jgi:hypothetical protein
VFLRERGGHAVGVCQHHPPIITADRANLSGPLAVTRHVGQGRYRYASREVLLGAVDEGHNRSSKRLLILALVLLQEAQANEGVDVRFV